MKKVASTSGGKSSIEMGLDLRLKHGNESVDFIFMDTGAEDIETYQFLKDCNKYYDLDLVTIRADFNQPLGKRHTYEITDVNTLKKDNYAMRGYMLKYGTPTFSTRSCTSRMKEEIHDMYCDDFYGRIPFERNDIIENVIKITDNKMLKAEYRKCLMKGTPNYETWIGIRFDEPKRLVGDHTNPQLSVYKRLRSEGLDDEAISDLYLDMKSNLDFDCDDNFGVWSEFNHGTIYMLLARVLYHKLRRIHYMAETTRMTKQDVINKWAPRNAPVSLSIDEHRGNCSFCPKKSKGKIALAARDLPNDAMEWSEMISEARQPESRPIPKEVMYAGRNTFDGIIAMFSDYSRDEIERTLRMSKAMESSCSESCEPFSG